MNKTIRNIIILMLTFIMIGVIPYIAVMTMTASRIKYFSKDTNIVIKDNGKIEVIDYVTFSTKNANKRTIKILGSFHAENMWGKPSYVSVKLDGKELEYNLYDGSTDYTTPHGDILIREINIVKGHKYKAEIHYEYNVDEVVKEYNNVAVLNLYREHNIFKSTIKIQLPQQTKIFDLKYINKEKYLGDNTYIIEGNIGLSNGELLIDKGIIKNAKKVNEEYNTVIEDDSSIVSTIIIFSIVSIICFIVTLILTKKVKIQKEYVRNPEEVIEPILAEAIIDKKIGAKELIMSCIVELIYRGNLKNIGNDKIQLLNYEKMSEYEIEIISLIFKEEGQIVTFDEIKDIFLKNNKETKTIFNKFLKIKKKIEKKLFDYNIYSKLGERILKILNIISIDLIIISLYTLFIGVIGQEDLLSSNMIKCIGISTVIAIVIGNIQKNKVNFRINNFELKFPIITCCFFIITIFLHLIIDQNVITNIIIKTYGHKFAISTIFIILLLNTITLIKSKLHVFTKTGKVEFAKVQGLKNYIIDYSLMKERDLESVIIWDEYLAYAVAFGIPNKITEKFGEGLMNTNIMLQKIESSLKIEL